MMILTKADSPSPSSADLDGRKAVGRGYLQSNRLDAALETYAGILRDYPQDVEAHLVLGDLYLAGGEDASAARLYMEALKLDPHNGEIARRIHLAVPDASAGVISADPSAEELIPTHPRAVARLLQRLTGAEQPISGEEMERAAALLQTILRSEDPAEVVAEHLEDVSGLLPALIELNIRQARADGRPDLAQALQELQTNLLIQVELARPRSGSAPQPAPRLPERAWVLCPAGPDGQISARAQVIGEALALAGIAVERFTATPGVEAPLPELVIACQPHAQREFLKTMAVCSAHQIPVIVDLECDFEQMPVSHPLYPAQGLGTQPASRAYQTALVLADQVTVPSPTFAQTLQAMGYASRVVPDGWNGANPLWERPPFSRATTHLGLFGASVLAEDVLEIRRVIVRVLREFPFLQLVVAGDAALYQLFESVPENRRLFLPAVDVEDTPYLFGQMDILMLPLRNIPFNQTLSDRLLVEAGARGIPWVASQLPAALAWGEGGLIAASPEEWHTCLRQLASDPEMRAGLGGAGRARAREREVHQVARAWKQVVQTVIRA